ncbi:unnamed protein product, partial [Symbiodinium pilosum]
SLGIRLVCRNESPARLTVGLRRGLFCAIRTSNGCHPGGGATTRPSGLWKCDVQLQVLGPWFLLHGLLRLRLVRASLTQPCCPGHRNS